MTLPLLWTSAAAAAAAASAVDVPAFGHLFRRGAAHSSNRSRSCLSMKELSVGVLPVVLAGPQTSTFSSNAAAVDPLRFSKAPEQAGRGYLHVPFP